VRGKGGLRATRTLPKHVGVTVDMMDEGARRLVRRISRAGVRWAAAASGVVAVAKAVVCGTGASVEASEYGA
jgi:hypothetical protein